MVERWFFLCGGCGEIRDYGYRCECNWHEVKPKVFHQIHGASTCTHRVCGC